MALFLSLLVVYSREFILSRYAKCSETHREMSFFPFSKITLKLCVLANQPISSWTICISFPSLCSGLIVGLGHGRKPKGLKQV